MSVRILRGDCRAMLATLDAESVDAVVTDPPYRLSPDKPWIVEIRPFRFKRSLAQNDRWQALTREIARETGDNHESLKRDLKVKFGFYEIVEVGGERFSVLKSTSKADPAEMGELMERVEAWAATELGVVIEGGT